MKGGDIVARFKHVDPDTSQQRRHAQVEAIFTSAASAVNDMCMDSREKSLAITKIEEAAMWANKAIAMEPPEDRT